MHEQLYEAAVGDDLAGVLSQLSLGASVNSQNRENRTTPLHVSSAAGHLTIVKELLDHGAVVNATDNVGQTPLHMAAQNGHAHVVKELLAHGALVDAVKIETHDTPLHLAAKNKHLATTGWINPFISTLKPHDALR
ncbi:hypothetical protein AC1031_021685 [Aphanomyces cochlioides]|nr:hypothetical protein AC1031_021685 [Aphanomyces cochlioides]